jgi:predicted kinase
MPTPDHLLDILCWHTKANKLLILLVGPPCSGKSSFDVLLQDRLPHTTINTDLGKDARSIETRIQYYRRLYEEALSFKQHIVVDQTNLSLEARKKYLERAPQYLHIALDFMPVSTETLFARSQQRQEETGRHVPQRVIQELVEAYRPPQFDEGFDYIFKVTQ